MICYFHIWKVIFNGLRNVDVGSGPENNWSWTPASGNCMVFLLTAGVLMAAGVLAGSGRFFWQLVSLLTAGVLLAAGVLADSWSSSGFWCPCRQLEFFWLLVSLPTAGVLPLLTAEVHLAAGVLANSWSSSGSLCSAHSLSSLGSLCHWWRLEFY